MEVGRSKTTMPYLGAIYHSSRGNEGFDSYPYNAEMHASWKRADSWKQQKDSRGSSGRREWKTDLSCTVHCHPDTVGVALSVALIFPLVPSDDMSNFMIKSENQPSCCTEHTHHGAVGSKKFRWQMPSESLNFALNSLRVGQVRSN